MTKQRVRYRPIDEAAVEVCREQGHTSIWYGDFGLCHDIYDRTGRRNNKHPINIISAVMSAIGRSNHWYRVGRINHLGRWYPVYAMTPEAEKEQESVSKRYLND